MRYVVAATAAVLAVIVLAGAERGGPYAEPAPAAAAPLKSAADFASIADPAQRSAALFSEAGKVLTHPRCMNCHPAGDRPSQGEDMHPHVPLVVRGEDGMGGPAMRCTACHQEQNYSASGVPGALGWHIAPVEMAWQGKRLAEICAQIKDTKRNGGRDLAGLVKHMEDPELVGWAWHPGARRTPAPGTQKDFVALIKAWTETGAVCPAG